MGNLVNGGLRRRLLMTAAGPLALAAAIGIATTAHAGSGQTRLGGASQVAVTSTAAAYNADGRMTMFAVDRGHAVWTRTQVAAGSDTWSSWSLFATALSTLVAQTNGDGLIEVFGADDRGWLWHRWQSAPDSGNWSRWELFTDSLWDDPVALTVTADANGRLALFALDLRGRIWDWTQYISSNGSNGGGSWSPPAQVDGTMAAIAAQTNGNGLIELFGTDISGRMVHRWELTHNTDSWAPWEDFYGGWRISLSSITATTMGPGGAVVMFYVLASTISGRTAYIGPNGSNGGGTWSEWSSMDGSRTRLTAISYPDGRIRLFGVDDAGRLFQRKELAAGTGTWSPWETVERPTTE